MSFSPAAPRHKDTCYSNPEERRWTRSRIAECLLPICAGCKKIRDDKGYWNQIEIYISSHSEAEFSHGLCPDCAKKAYEDLERMKGNVT